MVLQEDEENMNGNNIQEVMREVEETAQEESTSGPEIMNENEEENGIEVEINTGATAIEQVVEGDRAVGHKEVVKKPVIKKKYQPSTEDKSILRLQEQLNKQFQTSKRTEDILKQIQRKLSQIDKIAIVSNKQHEIVRKMQAQFGEVQTRLAKIDKSNTRLGSKGSTKAKSRVKVRKKNINNKKIKNSTKKSSRTK